MIGVATAIARNRPVTAHERKPSVESRSAAIVGSDADTIVIDDVNTITPASTVASTRRPYVASAVGAGTAVAVTCRP